MAEEKNFENRVKKYLEEKGCWLIKYWGGAAYTKAGVPDLLVCCNGKFLGIELKATNGRPSQLQLYHLRKIKAAGGFGCLLYPRHFEQFKQFIELVQSNQVINQGDYTFLYEWDFANVRK